MARTIKVDMTGVETYTKVSEGIHTAKVVEILQKESQGGDDMLQFAFEVTKGKDKGNRVFESFVLTDKALWKLKSFLQAIGMKADGKLKIDLDKLVGKVCDIEVFWDEYNGQTRAKISDYYKAGKGAANDTDEDEDIDDEADEDEDDDEDDTPAKKPAKKAPAKKASKKKPEPEDDDEDEDDSDEDDEDDDEEEEPAPKKRGRKPAPKKAPVKKGKKKPEPEDDEDDDEDEEWEEDD